MDAWEFYNVPRWMTVGASILNRDDRQAIIRSIDWNRREVRYEVDGDSHESTMKMVEFYGRFRPMFDKDGQQQYGKTSGSVRATPLLSAFVWSNRTINIVKREGWDALTVGEFTGKVSIEDMKNVKGVGRTVLCEFKDNLASAGLKMRKYSEYAE